MVDFSCLLGSVLAKVNTAFYGRYANPDTCLVNFSCLLGSVLAKIHFLSKRCPAGDFLASAEVR